MLLFNETYRLPLMMVILKMTNLHLWPVTQPRVVGSRCWNRGWNGWVWLIFDVCLLCRPYSGLRRRWCCLDLGVRFIQFVVISRYNLYHFRWFKERKKLVWFLTTAFLWIFFKKKFQFSQCKSLTRKGRFKNGKKWLDIYRDFA